MQKKADNQEFAELRKRALEVLDSYNRTDPDIFNGNIRKLIVELDTNRIELELQNEDLRIAQTELEKLPPEIQPTLRVCPCGLSHSQ